MTVESVCDILFEDDTNCFQQAQWGPLSAVAVKGKWQVKLLSDYVSAVLIRLLNQHVITGIFTLDPEP